MPQPYRTPAGHQSRLRLAAFAVLATAIPAISAVGASLTTVHAAVTVSRPAANSLPAPGTVLPRFSPVYMGSGVRMTQTQAIAVAQQFDVIATQSNTFGSYVGVMKAANPALRIVVDFDGTFDTSTGGTAYPSSWYETNKSGGRIRSNGFGYYLMNPANASWQQTLGQLCAAAIAKSHFDGCFLDTMGLAPLGAGYCTGLPINPSTGAVWTAPDWLSATGGTATTVLAANPGALVVVNGLANGARYFGTSGPSSVLLTPSGVAMAEVWMRVETQPVTTFRTEAKWLQDVNMLVDSEARGDSALTVTKLWVTATAAQQAQWHKFALASFLLGAGGHSYFSFLQDKSSAALTQDNAWDHVNIGTPSGAFAKIGGLYQRSFSNGIVAVNPTTVPVTINLGGTRTNLDGSVVTSETLAPDTADVFLLS